MKKQMNVIFGLMLIILCFNTVTYRQVESSKNDVSASSNESTNTLDTPSFPGYIKSAEKPSDGSLVTNAEIAGNFKTQAFFPGGTGFIYGSSYVGDTLINDPAGTDPYDRRNILEWVTYDDIKDDGTLGKEMYWRALSDEPSTWPNNTDWFYLRERNSPHEPSKIYSPVFTEDYEITGRVYWLSWYESNDAPPFSSSIDISFRQSLYLFNPADPLNPTLLARRTSYQYEPNIWPGQRSTYADITGTVTIPAGYRLRWDIEARFSYVPSQGSFLAYTGYSYTGGGSTTWTIDDANNAYDNTYLINNVTRMSGIQLYMRSKAYPDINIIGAMDNAVYQSQQAMTIDVTDGSISSYRWNSESWTSFSDSTLTTIPDNPGWNTLDVKASDPVYNNTKTSSYIFGYDKSIINVVLNSPLINGSSVTGGTTIDFDVYYVDTTEYTWDNGTWSTLESPYDIVAPLYNGEHILTIKTTDFYTNETVNYIFHFDSLAPTIELYNVLNDTHQAPGKVIEFNITDNVGIQSANYSWGSDPDQLWTPAQGTIYQTSLPEAPGYHSLVIKVYDVNGFYTEKNYRFFTDDELFLVELADLRNNSYYLGGNEVVINIQKSNGTIYYVWDSGILKSGTIISSQLILSGVDALSTDPGPHNLTIITFDYDNILHIFYFNFIVDLEAPVIDSSVFTSYNGTRFETSEIMDFLITDNYTSVNQLIVYIQIDNKANQTLTYPFSLSLLIFDDGTHNFTIYVYDLAGNYATQTIVFYVDTQAPIIKTVTIPELIEHLSTNYVKTGDEVIVTVEDSDPIVDTFYSWAGGSNSSFSGTITLSAGDGAGFLKIYANDSLGHISFYSIYLIIDNIAPQLDLTSPNELDEINKFTDLEFFIDEENIETVTTVRYCYDKLEFYYIYTTYDMYDSFSVRIPSLFFDGPGAYQTGDTATITIELYDIYENFLSRTFNFIIDRTAPLPGLFLNESGVYTNLINGGEYTSLGNTPVLYKNNTNDDIALFYYIWDDDDARSDYLDLNAVLINGYNFMDNVPDEDGRHTLKVTLTDNTISTQPNSKTYTFYITVNDIDVKVTSPNPEMWSEEGGYLSYHHRMNYTDSFVFIVNVTDTIDGSEIPDLQLRNLTDVYNFEMSMVKIDTTIYECIIIATNITEGVESYALFEFYLVGGGSQTVKIFLTVDKKLGTVEILEKTDLSIQYDEDLIVYVEMKDYLSQNLSILWGQVNSVITNFNNVENTSEYWFSYSTHGLVKGNHSIIMYVESTYFYAILEGDFTFEFTVTPLLLNINIISSNSTVLEGTEFTITAALSFENGTGVAGQLLHFYVYSYSYENTSEGVLATIPSNYTTYVILNRTTNINGEATIVFTMTADIDYVLVSVSFDGGDFLDLAYSEMDEKVIKIYPPGFPSWLLYTLIGGGLFVILIISLIVYKVTRGKPFEEVMEGISVEEIMDRYEELSPGVILTIFDQRKGPIPLIATHSLDTTRYLGRMQIGVENFLLKISDQAYSSLGFEEHDMGRRVGSIILPTEKMIGFVHGIQLPNKMARGGFENLSLIILADSEYGNLLLNNQEFVYDEVDAIIAYLKEKKQLKEVEELLRIIRHKSVKVMLAAEKIEQKKN